MNTQWKKFSDELPPEGATVLLGDPGKRCLIVQSWEPSLQCKEYSMWQEVIPPPKPVSPREEALAHYIQQTGGGGGCHLVFPAAWIAACKHIEEKIHELYYEQAANKTVRETCADIAKEAAE